MSQYFKKIDAGAQHQNSRAEWASHSIMYMECTFMVQTLLHWDNFGVDDIFL